MEMDEHFEDFTTASDWELFTAKLEQLLSEWMSKPAEPENITNNWLVIHEKITFADFPFKFSYFKKIQEKQVTTTTPAGTSADSTENSGEQDVPLPPYLLGAVTNECGFPPKNAPHVVSEYFDVIEFAVISSTGLEPVLKESRLKVLLSSACIAVNNINCNIPIFVQFHHWNQNYFCGIAEYSGIRTSFQMIMLRPYGNLPAHLSGLLDIFKSKIGSNLTLPVKISAHFFYKMRTWHSDFSFDSFPPELFDLIKNEAPSVSDELSPISPAWSQFLTQTAFLPFGSVEDPFLNLDFVIGWPCLNEDVVVDSPSYTDLEPENAQEWYFSLKPDSNAEFRLQEFLEAVWNLKNDSRTVETILGKSIDDNRGSVKYTSALDKITKNNVTDIPVVGINKVLRTARRQVLFNPDAYDDLAPLSTDQMDALTKFLFPDANPDSKYPVPSTWDQIPEFQKEHIVCLLEGLQGVKSAPLGSLVWRLSIVIGYLLTYGGSVGAVAHIWAEFVLELRFRVDNSIIICGLESGSPNSGTCLLNQKLQMLNCCIEKKLAREKREKERYASDQDVNESGCEEIEEEDDEFFDCEENLEIAEKVSKLNKPSGRKNKNGRLRLVKTGEPMYLPITQEPAPLTEDVMEEQSNVLIELGEDAQASELRAKMMSASLHSDMESFKAANPGAELEDFVRWYSPRDWVESEEIDEFGNKLGELSPRMKVPGNLWHEVWSTAQPVPARRQKRLFDDTKEAEKVLHWLSSRSLKDISELLFPCLVHAATLKVLEEADKLSFEYQIPQTLPQYVVQLSRSYSFISKFDNDFKETNNYKNHVIGILTQCEKEITQIKSFQYKFPTMQLEEILRCKEKERETYGNEFLPNYIKVDRKKMTDIEEVLKDMFLKEATQSNIGIQPQQQQSEFKFGIPFKRVFILKYTPQRNSSLNVNTYSCLPQRMSCLLKDDMFILAGTFSSKTSL